MSLINRVLTDAIVTLSQAAYAASIEDDPHHTLDELSSVIEKLEALRLQFGNDWLLEMANSDESVDISL